MSIDLFHCQEIKKLSSPPSVYFHLCFFRRYWIVWYRCGFVPIPPFFSFFFEMFCLEMVGLGLVLFFLYKIVHPCFPGTKLYLFNQVLSPHKQNFFPPLAYYIIFLGVWAQFLDLCLSYSSKTLFKLLSLRSEAKFLDPVRVTVLRPCLSYCPSLEKVYNTPPP